MKRLEVDSRTERGPIVKELAWNQEMKAHPIMREELHLSQGDVTTEAEQR